MENLTFEDLLNNLKQTDKETKDKVEIAEDVAKIINNIMYARLNKNLSQRDLAKLCGIPQSAIARMERLQVIPRIDTVIKIAHYVGVNLYAQIVEEQKEKAHLSPVIYNVPPKITYKINTSNTAACTI